MNTNKSSLIIRNINSKIHNVKIRKEVWVENCGKNYEIKCPVSWCENMITSFDFCIGFKTPIKGSEISLENSLSKCLDNSNLIPLCRRCSNSMNYTKSFSEWDKKYKLIKLKPFETLKFPELKSPKLNSLTEGLKSNEEFKFKSHKDLKSENDGENFNCENPIHKKIIECEGSFNANLPKSITPKVPIIPNMMGVSDFDFPVISKNQSKKLNVFKKISNFLKF